MAKNVRISDELYALAQWEAGLQDRSIAQQLEHWAKRGIAATGTVDATQAAIALTRKLDALEVERGGRDAESLHFIPRSMAKRSKPAFPSGYRRS
jgi:hypothetical protein